MGWKKLNLAKIQGAGFAVPHIRSFPWKNFKKQGLLILWTFEALGIFLLIGFLFYDRIWVGLLLSPLGFLYIKKKQKDCAQKERERLTNSFKEGMQSIATSLAAGYSIENAIAQAASELELIYGENDPAAIGFQKVIRRISLNQSVEEAFEAFAQESNIEEIMYFSQVLTYAKRNGGNLIQIIRNTTDMIVDRLEVNREIITMTTAKRYEQKIMNLIPLLMVAYMRFASFGLMEKLYGNMIGVLTMSACLLIYYAGIRLAESILKIEV